MLSLLERRIPAQQLLSAPHRQPGARPVPPGRPGAHGRPGASAPPDYNTRTDPAACSPPSLPTALGPRCPAGPAPGELVRSDANVPPLPLPGSRPGAFAAALAEVNTYPHGGYPGINEAIAAYAGVEPENVVLGAGGDDLILLCARAFAGPGDVVSVPPDPTYPLFRVAAERAGATARDDSPVRTFCSRPGNPHGCFPPLPSARQRALPDASA